MNRLMREAMLPDIVVDCDRLDSKHDSISLREAYTPWRAGDRKRFITARPLAKWLISDWQHKRRHMHLPDLDFTPVRSGLFYSLRLGGTWVAADWWLQYFDVNEQVTALRLEHLQHDLNRFLLPLLPADTPPFGETPRENCKPDGMAIDEPCFTPADLTRIAAVNPRWSAWERDLYPAQ